MNHFVPDFDTNVDYVNTTTNNLPTKRKPILGHEEEEDDALMELLWQDGQVVLQNQRHNTVNKRLPSSSVKFHGGGGESAPSQSLDQNLFIQDDEMSSWLHFPLRHDDFSSDLLFSSSSAAASAPPPQSPPFAAVTAEKQEMRPLQPSPRSIVPSSAKPPSPFSNSPKRPPEPSIRPLAPPIRSVAPSYKPPVPTERRPIRNFMNFSRLRRDFKGQNESGPSITKPIVRESTQVNPINTPSSPPPPSVRESGINSRLTTVNSASSSAVAEGSGAYSIGVSDKGKAVAVTSSMATETEKKIEEDRKRKEREAAIDDEAQCRSEEAKQGRVGSTKRSRAAQVHNLSERKRRDRINERMKSLQELIPRCNKSDKASMLDEAIEYMKSLQLQIQMMSMGCGMMPPPMMYPPPQGGAMQQQYIPHHHLAMGMGILGMDITTMNQYSPFMPFPNMLTPQIRPNLPTQAHHIGGFPLPNQQFDPTSGVQSQYPPPPPPNGYMDPYHQFRNLQPPQFQQNQATSYPSSSRVSSSKESGDRGNKPTG